MGKIDRFHTQLRAKVVHQVLLGKPGFGENFVHEEQFLPSHWVSRLRLNGRVHLLDQFIRDQSLLTQGIQNEFIGLVHFDFSLGEA